MKIARVSCWVLKVPFRYPLFEEDSTMVGTFVEIETDDGTMGHALSAYSMPYSIRDFINREVGPAIVGMEPLDIEAVRFHMYWSLAGKFSTGAYACAASLIDVALWDIKGKVTGQPVWRLLGGARQMVPVYVTFGLPSYSTEQLIEVANLLISRGLSSLKLAVSAPKPQGDEMLGEATDDLVKHDAARVRALREELGPDVELMMDANKNSTMHQAIRLAKLIEPYDLVWFEDPVLKADPRIMAQVRKSTNVPIAAGSTGTFDLTFLKEYLLHEAVDYLQPNVRDIGGFTGGLKAAALAESFNIPIQMGGNWPHMNMHLHAGVPNGGRVEFHWQGWQIGVMLFDGAPEPANNVVTLPDRPGLGYTPKEGIVQEYAVD